MLLVTLYKIAHLYPYPLNSLSLKLELLKDELENEKMFSDISREIDRLDALTESYLRQTKAKLREEEKSTLNNSSNLQEVIKECINLFENEFFSAGITLQLDLQNEEIWVGAPSSVIKAVLINLFKNAKEALGEVDHPDQFRQIHVGARVEQNHWTLLMDDSGQGFDPHYLSKAFSLFQSTKKEGSGLGLYTSKKMLEAYNISIKISRSPLESFGARVELSGAVASSENLVQSDSPISQPEGDLL
jgi:two-component system, sporulation sensor kinase D